MYDNEEYDISTSFIHEATTELYVYRHQKNLSLYDLIKLGIKDDNYNYVNYLVFKRLSYIKRLISLKSLRFDMLLNLDIDEEFNDIKITPKQYENKLIYYANRINEDGDLSVSIEDLIEETYLHLDWPMMYYVYKHERQNLLDFIKREDEEYCDYINNLPKNRKFFIIKM